MKTKMIEVTNGPRNWGKMLVGRFEFHEWQVRSAVSDAPSLLVTRGWTDDHILVLDLETGEGALFRPGGSAAAAKNDLDKHRIWVCPLFEPFLAWLYTQDTTDLDALPDHVDLPEAEFQMAGYRRPGTSPEHDVLLHYIGLGASAPGVGQEEYEGAIAALDALSRSATEAPDGTEDR